MVLAPAAPRTEGSPTVTQSKSAQRRSRQKAKTKATRAEADGAIGNNTLANVNMEDSMPMEKPNKPKRRPRKKKDANTSGIAFPGVNNVQATIVPVGEECLPKEKPTKKRRPRKKKTATALAAIANGVAGSEVVGNVGALVNTNPPMVVVEDGLSPKKPKRRPRKKKSANANPVATDLEVNVGVKTGVICNVPAATLATGGNPEDQPSPESKKKAKRRPRKKKPKAITNTELTDSQAEDDEAEETVTNEVLGVTTKAKASTTNKGAATQRRTRPVIEEAGGIALLPCEEELAPLLDEFKQCHQAGDDAGMEASQLEILRRHPFVVKQDKKVPEGALAPGVNCEIQNFKMDTFKFKKWLRTDVGKPFEERGKGFDDGCYLTSAVLRNFMPRGFTHFTFSNNGGAKVTVVLRGFMKFTGMTAADEDEDSNATAELDVFMFHGFRREDASRFAVTTKSNGENGKYTMRTIFGEWYCFAGSKNTGMVWRLGSDVATLYPVVEDNIASVGPKIVRQVNSYVLGLPAGIREACLTAVDQACLTVMVELNDPDHEHIYPIYDIVIDHVALLDSRGYPVPQRQASTFFEKFKMPCVTCEIYQDMNNLTTVTETIRARTDIEGAVIYLERADDTAVGLVKIKSDHYVIARRTRQILQSTLVSNLSKEGTASFNEALDKTRTRLKKGMHEMTHVQGCKEHHEKWAAFAIAFAVAWATAYKDGNIEERKELVSEFYDHYGSLYHRFSATRNVLPLCDRPSRAKSQGVGEAVMNS
eukprot:TRINITY_DN39179_c0_g1_i1.p1 TRINITY_DN39179_c0_g1~~TRINITY_DN39179_c0_g1_i1.p1  ORF type:complete len:763 (+),score=148.34 TRINITY_DN39179_c0_g1_i1:92-2380(+)